MSDVEISMTGGEVVSVEDLVNPVDYRLDLSALLAKMGVEVDVINKIFDLIDGVETDPEPDQVDEVAEEESSRVNLED